jgi:perosamine synthetase
MDRLAGALERRDTAVARYEAALGAHPAVELLATRPHVRHARHLFMIRLCPAALRVERDRVLSALKAEGIGVAVHYRALPEMTYYRQELGCDPGKFPVAVGAGRELVSLPLFPTMTDRDIEDVIRAVQRTLAYYAA